MSRKADPAAASPAALTRRALVAGLPLFLGACAGGPSLPDLSFLDPDGGADYASMYGPLPDEKFPVPGLPVRSLESVVLRRMVDDPTGEAPGTIVVDPAAKHLYWVQNGGRAVRYGIGVGKQGFEWNGRAKIARKAEWPTWTPTSDMIERDPDLNGRWSGGMPGGLQNPLGARALYLYQGGRDTLYRVHGTNAPRSIGKAVSSGCIRMFNHDIIDLHRRVPVGTEVVVLQA